MISNADRPSEYLSSLLLSLLLLLLSRSSRRASSRQPVRCAVCGRRLPR